MNRSVLALLALLVSAGPSAQLTERYQVFHPMTGRYTTMPDLESAIQTAMQFRQECGCPHAMSVSVLQEIPMGPKLTQTISVPLPATIDCSDEKNQSVSIKEAPYDEDGRISSDALKQ